MEAETVMKAEIRKATVDVVGDVAVFSKSDGGPGHLLTWLSNAFVRR